MSIPQRLGLETVDLGDHRLVLRRAWPRGGRKLHLEYLDHQDRIWAGQWYGDDTDRHRLERIRRHTSAVASDRQVRVVEGLRLVVQGGGADRKLTSLSDVAGEAGNTIVSHRAERRGVVRLAGGRAYTKVVEPAKASALLHSGQSAAALGVVSAPRLLRADPARGAATWTALPGRTINQMGNETPSQAWAALGSQLRDLHDTPAPPGLPTHGRREEAAVIENWHRRFAAFAPDDADRLSPVLTGALTALEGDDPSHGVIHRDLHDKQVLVDRRGQIHWIDFDTLSVGDPAIDLANLLVHLDLRVAQGSLSPQTAAEAAGAVVEAYRPTAALSRRVGAYAAATVLRLHYLYSFRPSTLTSEWLTSARPSVRVLT